MVLVVHYLHELQQPLPLLSLGDKVDNLLNILIDRELLIPHLHMDVVTDVALSKGLDFLWPSG